MGYLAPRACDPTSESLEPIQSARAEDDLRAALSEHDRSRLAYSATCARDDDDIVFDAVREVLLFAYPVRSSTDLARREESPLARHAF